MKEEDVSAKPQEAEESGPEGNLHIDTLQGDHKEINIQSNKINYRSKNSCRIRANIRIFCFYLKICEIGMT